MTPGHVRLSVLGPLRGHRDGRELNLGAPQQRAFLTVLLALDTGGPAPVQTITDVLWGERVTAAPAGMVQQYVSRLRRVLGPGPSGRSPIEWAGTGYRMADDIDIDLVHFRRLVRRATTGPGDALGPLIEALSLWRGPIAADMPIEVREHPVLAAIGAEYTTALELAVGLAPARGRRDDVLRLLDRNDTWYPGGADLRERLRIAPANAVRPVQVPAAPGVIVGRDGELDALSRRPDGPTVVSGVAGIGKTALVNHWAHRFAADWPDGQLFVDLRGSGVTPAVALRGFLEALGVPSEEQPEDLSGRARLYQRMLAGRRMLVVLDDAADADQVRPLLPDAVGCRAVITSRQPFSGLGDAIRLGPLSPGAARAYLAGRLGSARLAAEPAAVTRIVDLCAGSPLALSTCAAWAIRHPGFPLAHLAEDLDLVP